MPGDWLADRRSEVAADRILDAAEGLFAEQDAATVGMREVARAAGCSRATLYRYFESRDALFTAYVNRETYRLYQQIGEQIGGLADPGERLVSGILAALQRVRQRPALASWFTHTARPIGVDHAGRSEVIEALVQGFLTSLNRDDARAVERRARWVVRVITSLLVFPGEDDAAERAMLEEFVVPIVVPAVATP